MDRDRNTTGPMNSASINSDCAKEPGYLREEKRAQRLLTPEEQERIYLIGKNVLFAPPQACKIDTTPEFYPAIIVKVNGAAPEFAQVRMVDLVTFGPNSIYFQHNVPFSERGIKAGHWTLPRVVAFWLGFM